MPEEKEQDPDVTAEEEPDADEPKELTDNPSTITADDVPVKEAALPVLPPEVEALFRKIAKEEIGKALGHTIV